MKAACSIRVNGKAANVHVEGAFQSETDPDPFDSKVLSIAVGWGRPDLFDLALSRIVGGGHIWNKQAMLSVLQRALEERVPYACVQILKFLESDKLHGANSTFAGVDMISLYNLFVQKFDLYPNRVRDQLRSALDRDAYSRRNSTAQTKLHRYRKAVGLYFQMLTGSRTILEMVSKSESVFARDVFLWATGVHSEPAHLCPNNAALRFPAPIATCSRQVLTCARARRPAGMGSGYETIAEALLEKCANPIHLLILGASVSQAMSETVDSVDAREHFLEVRSG